MFKNVDLYTLLIATLVFILALSLWIIAVWAWAIRRRQQQAAYEKRLGILDGEPSDGKTLRLWLDGKQVTTTVAVEKQNRSLAQRLEHWRQMAGFESSVATIALGLLGVVCGVSLGLLLWTESALAAAGGAATVVVVFFAMVKRRTIRREALFDQQLIDALDLAARSLRAGHPLGGAFHLIAEEIPAPVGTVFAEICQQVSLGVSHEEAMRKAARASHSEDVRLFTTCVAIQLRSGGNLADMMMRLAQVIRDRMRLNRRVRVLTAQANLSKNVLLALPFVMFVALNLLNPRYMVPLYETATGQSLLIGAGISLLFGAWVMGRLAQLKY
jgi:tight adherence protein B